MHKFSSPYEVSGPTTLTVSGSGGASAPSPTGLATRAAPVLEKFLVANYAFSRVRVVAVRDDVFVELVQGVYEHRFVVPSTVVAAGFLVGVQFVQFQADEFLRETRARAYGFRFETAELPAAPRSPICPCGIDRRDCEYHL
jgi:hypothetical protein